ncbi:MAG: META domain-containing protein [Dongiaceae bacterium]
MPGETLLQLNGSAWVLESATSAPAPAQPAPPATTTATESAQVTPAPAPAPISAAWLLPDRGARPTLTFSSDRNSASGAAGCNRYFRTFSAGSNQLWSGNVLTTKMMCFDTLAVQEIQYLGALAKVQAYQNDGATLTLSTSDGRRLTYSPFSNPVGARAAIYNDVCNDGLYFSASFDPPARTAALQVSTGATDTWTQETSGSGVSYGSARPRLHAKGNDALLDTLYDGVTHHRVAPLAPQG